MLQFKLTPFRANGNNIYDFLSNLPLFLAQIISYFGLLFIYVRVIGSKICATAI